MNATAYNDCVRKLSDALYRFACKCTGNQETAKDVVQSSFEALWMKREQVTADKAKAFLFQVAYNQSVTAWRTAGRQVLGDEGMSESWQARSAQPGLKNALEAALATLDAQARALVLLKDYEGYSYAEIGKLTDLNESQVKVYLFRGREETTGLHRQTRECAMKTNAMVTIDNYEEYLMLAADGELDATGMAALGAFLQAHPDLAGEAEVWKTSLKLQPDMEQVYEQKEALLQKEPRQIALTWKTFSIAAAAAIVFALFAVPALWQHDKVPGIAHHFLQPSPLTTQVNSIAQSTSERPSNTLPQNSQVETSHTTQQRHPSQQTPKSTTVDALASLSSESPTPVSIPSIKQELSSVPSPGTIALLVEPENPQPSPDNTGLPRIRLAAPDASAVHMLKRGVEQRIADAAALAHSIRETAFAVRIGNKNHYLNF